MSNNYGYRVESVEYSGQTCLVSYLDSTTNETTILGSETIPFEYFPADGTPQGKVFIYFSGTDQTFVIDITQPNPSPTPTNTPTPTITITPTTTPTSTNTPTPSVTPTETPTNTPTNTITPTTTETPTNTPTSTVTPTVTPSVTPTNTITPTQTPTVTPTVTITPTSSPPPTVPLTFNIGTNGESVTFDGITYTSTTTVYVYYNVYYPVSCTPKPGYEFAGWNTYGAAFATSQQSTQVVTFLFDGANFTPSFIVSPTPTPTNTSTPTVTPTNTETPTNTPTNTPTSTVTPTQTITPSPTTAVPVTSDLVLYFDPSNSSSYSGSGTTINDLSGYGLSGTMSNITFTSPYFSFNGSSSQISVADNSLLEPGSGDWTIEFWVNHSVLAGSSRILIAKTDGINAADWAYGLRSSAAGGTFMEIGNGSTSIITPTSTLSINTWYQVVGVWTNVASNSLALYINGSLIGSNSHSFTSIKNTTSPLYLGSFNGGQSSQWLNGRMGVVRLYSKALTSSEVLQNYNADKSKYGL